MGLQIKNETVYVIYRNGKPYDGSGRKIVYTNKGSAKGVITNVVSDEIRQKSIIGEIAKKDESNAFEDAIKDFEIVEYAPRINLSEE